MNLFSLEGRTALITGASRGVGLAIAEALAQAGARVILNGRSQPDLDAAAQGLRKAGAQVETSLFDVTDAAAAAAAVDAIEGGIGPIDILVNNAGIQRRGPLETYPEADWRALMAANLDSLYFISKAVAPRMIARGRGKIINIGSVLSEVGRPGTAAYAAAKGGVKNLTRGMCADWARHGLQINAIGPGYIVSPLNKPLMEDPQFNSWLIKRTPAGRWGDLADLHGAAVFLASDASDFVNGQILYVDGGMLAVL